MNFYNDSNNTGNITVDGIASYVYNSSGYLTRAKDGLSGYEIRYTYSGGKVTSAREFGGNALGQIVGLSYHSGYTEIRNSGADDIYNNADDLITRYTFDKSGRAVSIYTTDSTKTQIFGATAGEYESEDKIKNNIKTKTAIGGSATNYLLNGGFADVKQRLKKYGLFKPTYKGAVPDNPGPAPPVILLYSPARSTGQFHRRNDR